MSGLLTYLVEGELKRARTEFEGRIISRPTLLVTDGLNATWGADVDIGKLGRSSVDPNTGEETVQPLRNVPIASGAHEITYADVGCAVTVRRSASGRYEIVGFSKRLPGTYTRIPVTLGEPGLAGPVNVERHERIDAGLVVRPLTYEELATLGGGYGTCAYGAVGIWIGGELKEIRS